MKGFTPSKTLAWYLRGALGALLCEVLALFGGRAFDEDVARHVEVEHGCHH